MEKSSRKNRVFKIGFTITVGAFLLLIAGLTAASADILSVDSYNVGGAGVNDLGLWTGWGSSGTSTVAEVYLHRYEGGSVNNAKKFIYNCSGAESYCWDASNLWNNSTYLNISEFEYLSFRIKGGGGDFYIEMQYGTPIGGGSEPVVTIHSSDYFTITDEWKQVNLPLTAFAGLDKTKMRAIVIKFNNTLNVDQGIIYLDNLEFSNGYGKPESAGPVRINRETKTLIVGNEPYRIKGVGYQPIPIGWTPPNLDNAAFYDRDFPILANMGCNTIRAWGMPGINLLNKAEEYGIKVIAGFWMDLSANFNDTAVRNAIKQQFTTFVNTYKNSPALLLWAIGNENNYHNGAYADYYSLCNELAEMAYQIEGAAYHPVIIVNGHLFNVGVRERGAEDLQLDYIDAWGCNVYAEDFSNINWNGDMRDFFQVYEEKSVKPIIITEYGADAFYTTNRWSLDGYEDEDTQANWVQNNTLKIKAASRVCLGSTVMEYSDEWWKYSAGNTAVQDRGGFYTGDWGSVSPDDYANEEYWGVVKIAPDGTWSTPDGLNDVKIRKVYYALQSIFIEKAAPLAGFSASPTGGIMPLAVNFTDTSTGNITGWLWDFGDSYTSTEQNPAHAYAAIGNYTVSVTVTGPGGSDTETKINYIVVTTALSPAANFTASPTAGVAPLAVNFIDTSTGNITNWSWDFGDTGTSTSQNPIHVYDNQGLYTVRLTVAGPGGSDTETKTNHIMVSYPPHVADFTADVTTGKNPLTVNFTDTSTGNITGWLWDFGDSYTSTEQDPAHVYAVAGTYTVSLTVTAFGGNNTETKTDYISVFPADTIPPTISITLPDDNSGLDDATVDVSGTVSDVCLDKVELAVEVDGSLGPWSDAAVVEENFSGSVIIPDDGRSAIIVAKATDMSANTSEDRVRVIKGHVRFIKLPAYYKRDDNYFQISSLAVAKDMIDLMRPDPDLTFPVENDIYSYAHPYNLPKNQSLADLDPKGMDAVLEHFDIYNPYGYNFGIEQFTNINTYLKEIIHWMNWPVLKNWGDNPPPGTDPENSPYFADEPYIPVVLPLYADTEGYSRWVIVNGSASDISPFEYNTQPWRYAHSIATITVYGLFLTDPETSGIGENTYIASSSLSTYLRPMPLHTIPNKYNIDQYVTSYIMVAEPPPEECDLTVEIPEPVVNDSTLRLVEIAKYKNSESIGSIEKHLIDSALLVELDEKDASKAFSIDASPELIFDPCIMVEDQSSHRISWKEVIDSHLLLNEDFKNAVNGTIVREFIKIYREDTDTYYYIVPFDKFRQGRFLSYAAIIVDAEDGHFIQGSSVKEPVRYVQITKEDAVATVLGLHPEAVSENIEARLVWKPGDISVSPFHPYWEVKVGEKMYYVAE